MSLPDIARRLERVTSTVSIAGRTLLGLDTNPIDADWAHITKIDPEGEKQLPLCYPLYLSHTSAISVGGSRDVTRENTEETFGLLEYAPVPAFHEPSDAGHVTDETRDQAAFLAIPEVLNGDSEALVGTLGRGVEYVRDDLGPTMIAEKLGCSLDGALGERLGNFAAGYMLEDAVFEAYIIMNPDSAAAREASVTEEDLLTPEEARQRALAAEYHLESEVIYLEYSGTYGGDGAVEILEAISDGVTWSRIWYGGGLDSREDARAVLDAGADAVIVGDIFHDIASEEAELFEAAREEFDGLVDRAEVREWVTDTVTVGETNAARYLSTITGVPEPEEQAVEYLAASVELGLALDEIAAELKDPTLSEIRRKLRTETLPVEDDLTEALDSDANEFVRTLGESLLSERAGLDRDGEFPPQHIGVTL